MNVAADLTFDVVIIGGGVVGLAMARQLARRDRKLAVLEKNDRCGQETSSRNSEVIHAGIYYPRDFLKSRLCVEGNRRLYEWCRDRNIPHARIGKLIVASDTEEEAALPAIKNGAEQNNLTDLEIIAPARLRNLEPAVTARAAVFSPSTGIVDSHRLMLSLRADAEARGAIVSCRACVTAIHHASPGYDLEINNGAYRLHTKALINSAGLHADTVAGLAGIDIDAAGYRLRPCKGNYFSASPSPALRHLVYPVPMKNNVGLGIHATLDLAGRVRFGPDSRYLEAEETRILKRWGYRTDDPETSPGRLYAVDEGRREAFAAAVARYLPGMAAASFVPEMSGIRPKLQGPGEPAADFIIREEGDRGMPGFINLIGIESPGLTACLAIAVYVAKKYFHEGE
ncbi:MAG TPA: NAD(P)/FAD-dependent oxidoreductase [Syntrophales bacterium]|nr:NAD(P)/FAD-dependent oxidoreductase [Syntrophales bacterium]